jgi:hypothetical protein
MRVHARALYLRSCRSGFILRRISSLEVWGLNRRQACYDAKQHRRDSPAEKLTLARNFLLFLPTHTETPELKEILSYYSSTISLNSEGDTSISEDTLDGLGRTRFSYISAIFGSIQRIADSPNKRSRASPDDAASEQQSAGALPSAITAGDDAMLDSSKARLIEATLEGGLEALPKAKQPASRQIPRQKLSEQADLEPEPVTRRPFLREIAPDPGQYNSLLLCKYGAYIGDLC